MKQPEQTLVGKMLIFFFICRRLENKFTLISISCKPKDYNLFLFIICHIQSHSIHNLSYYMLLAHCRIAGRGDHGNFKRQGSLSLSLSQQQYFYAAPFAVAKEINSSSIK